MQSILCNSEFFSHCLFQYLPHAIKLCFNGFDKKSLLCLLCQKIKTGRYLKTQIERFNCDKIKKLALFPTQWKDKRLRLLLKLKSTHMSTHLHQIQSSPNPIQIYFICICGLFYFCHSLHNHKDCMVAHFGSLHEHHAKTIFISIIGSILLLFDVELSVMMF